MTRLSASPRPTRAVLLILLLFIAGQVALAMHRGEHYRTIHTLAQGDECPSCAPALDAPSPPALVPPRPVWDAVGFLPLVALLLAARAAELGFRAQAPPRASALLLSPTPSLAA